MGETNTGESMHSAEVSDGGRRCDLGTGGLVIIGPTASPVDGLDRLLSCPTVRPVAAMADRMVSWSTVTDEVLEVTRLTSQVIRNGQTAVVYLDSHNGDSAPVPVEAREFVCIRLGQIMIGLADVPSFVALNSERLARALIVDSLGDGDVETVATIPGGFPVWELTQSTMFPGVPVAAAAGDASIDAMIDIVNWFNPSRRD